MATQSHSLYIFILEVVVFGYVVFLFLFVCLFVCFLHTVSYTPGWPGTQHKAKGDLELLSLLSVSSLTQCEYHELKFSRIFFSRKEKSGRRRSKGDRYLTTSGSVGSSPAFSSPGTIKVLELFFVGGGRGHSAHNRVFSKSWALSTG